MLDISEIKVGDKIVIPWTGSFGTEITNIDKKFVYVNCFMGCVPNGMIPLTNVIYNEHYEIPDNTDNRYYTKPDCKWVYVEDMEKWREYEKQI